MSSNRHVLSLLALLVALAIVWPIAAYFRYASQAAPLPPPPPGRIVPDPDDPPQVAIGERLFRESRFAQFFAAHSAGSVNAVLPQGDPILGRTVTASGSPLPGPFAASSMSCRGCHMVDEQAAARNGSRSYTDFGRQSPITIRDDGLFTTTRNSPTAVDASLPRRDLLLHFDGEFSSAEDLVHETLLGRNFGWLPNERATALHQLARVIREDDGSGALARAFGGPYPALLAGASSVPASLRLPAAFRLDVARATDAEIADRVALLISEYLRSLAFHRDAQHRFDGSPYDRFLAKNGLPREPLALEADSIYARRLADRLAHLEHPSFVDAHDGAFRLHDQTFAFGPLELRGLQVFLARPGGTPTPGMGIGNCASCHAPPHFTDFSFHNTGATESQYDAIHGAGSFAKLYIPDLATRNADFNAWLPATATHPLARGPFRSPPSRMQPAHADLGLWNVLGNPDLPKPQAAILAVLGRDRAGRGTAAALPVSIACFKTPSLRDLGHSAPYLHTGRADSLEQVLAHYVEFSARARAGTMRNPEPRLKTMVLGREDLIALAAFLKSLNEDYE